MLLVRYLDNDLGRVAFARVAVHFYALVPHVVFGAFEDRNCDAAQVHVLRRRAACELLSEHLRIGIRGHEMQPCTLRLAMSVACRTASSAGLEPSVPTTIERDIVLLEMRAW